MRKEKLAELKYYIQELETIKLSKKEEEPHFIGTEVWESTLNNGQIIKREKILKNKRDGSAVIIFPITSEGNILLVVQPRVFIKRTVGIELPAGYIESNEKPVKTALRELVEETGYTPQNIEFLTKCYQDQGCSSALNYSFLAFNCQKQVQQNLDKDEFIRYFECTYQEMQYLIAKGYIMDANSLLTISKAEKVLKQRKIML